MKHLKTYNENLRDQMKPKTDEEFENNLKKIIFKSLDKAEIQYALEDKSKDLWGFGVSCINKISINMSQKDLFDYVLDADNQLADGDYELYPLADKIIKEWININFSDWDDDQIEEFITGIGYSGFFT